MKKGIVVNVVNFPETCQECELVEENGYCPYVEKYIDHYEFDGRYPTCPIVDMPEKDPEDYFPDEFQDGIATGWNMCIDRYFGNLRGLK